jgi:serine/threonine protein phosphatase 1
MATLAIGDVHGNHAALSDLLDRVSGEAGSGDTVVFLGDYIDRGPETRRCIDAILDFRGRSTASVVCLRGNHEDWLLRTLGDYTSHSWLLGMDGLDMVRSYSAEAASTLREARRNAGSALYLSRVPLPYEVFFDAMPPAHRSFLTALELTCSTDDCFCSHGGIDPELALEGQRPDAYIWGGAGFPEKYCGETPIVYGHWNDAIVDDDGWPHPNIRPNTIGVDTSKHGVVSAIRLPDRRVFQSGRYPN